MAKLLASNKGNPMLKQQIEALNRDLAENKENEEEGADIDGIDDKNIACFLEAGLQPGTLRSEIELKECTFLVNMINQSNQKAIPYEPFIDFLIPQSNKKVSGKLLNRIKRKDVCDIKP